MAKKAVKKPTANTTFSAEERAAMRARVQEVKAQARGGQQEAEEAVLAALAAMPPSDRALGERIHAIVKANAPMLNSKLWYGMPAYVRDGKVVCLFQGAYKFKTRYASLAFQHEAKLDDGNLWPVAFALLKLTAAEEKRIVALVKKAVG